LSVSDNDLVQAQGLAFSLIGSLLEGHGVLPPGEFGRHLAVLANVTRESAPAQGEILSVWAALAAKVTAHKQN
jgi:hypothetical protein